MEGTIWTTLLPGRRKGDSKEAKCNGPLRKLNPVTNKVSGYLQIGLRKNSKTYMKYVHILVLEAFKGLCPPGMESCHEDGVKSNCDIDNLRWDTHAANKEDCRRHGTMPLGEKASRSKLTEKQTEEIFKLRSEKWTHKRIAEKLKVSRPTISLILEGKNWKHQNDNLQNMKQKIGDWQADTKLSNNDIEEIFKLKNAGLSQKDIARRFNISRPYVSQILSKIKRSSTTQRNL
jgi:transcriptional regulator